VQEAVARHFSGSGTAKTILLTAYEEKGSFLFDPGSYCIYYIPFHITQQVGLVSVDSYGHSRELPDKQFHSILSFSNDTLCVTYQVVHDDTDEVQ